MIGTSVVVCRSARSSHWQLGPVLNREGRLTLIGWKQVPDRGEAGVPTAIAEILAHALTQVAQVTFPCSTAGPGTIGTWLPWDKDQIRRVRGRGWTGLLGAAWCSSDIVLQSTRRPEKAVRLFDDPRYSWSLQNQVALLTLPGQMPPDFDRGDLLDLLADAWAERAASLSAAGVVGALHPGVDGDLAGLLSLAQGLESELLAALEAAAISSGLAWAVLTEDDFAEHLSSRSP